jgi:hypothetical protein
MSSLRVAFGKQRYAMQWRCSTSFMFMFQGTERLIVRFVSIPLVPESRLRRQSTARREERVARHGYNQRSDRKKVHDKARHAASRPPNPRTPVCPRPLHAPRCPSPPVTNQGASACDTRSANQSSRSISCIGGHTCTRRRHRRLVRRTGIPNGCRTTVDSYGCS